MKNSRRSLSIGTIGVALVMLAGNAHAQQVPIPQTAAEVPGPAPGPMPKAWVEMVGRMAYAWGWPLVYVHNRRETLTKVPEVGLLAGVLPIAPINQLGMLTTYIDPGEVYIADPNQDVVYGLAFLYVGEEPVIIQVPNFGDRFWSFPVYDARTDQRTQLGLARGTEPGFYMMVGPNWKGEKPAGVVAVIRSNTDYLEAMPRIFITDSPEDQKSVQAALSQLAIYPLSQFDGRMKTKDWSKLPSFPAPKKDYPGPTKWVDPTTFFDVLPIVMKEVPPLPGEESLYKWIGSVLDAAAKDPEVKKTLQETALAAEKELIAPTIQWRFNGSPVANGWTSPDNNAAFGTDYYHRAAAVNADPYDSTRTGTMYFYTDNDSQLNPLEGKSSYSITFAKGGLPPSVKQGAKTGFWSLTLYNKYHFFASNALKRYSLGTKNSTLQYNADGSLTLYVGAKSPGKDKESNWVPAPDDVFSLWIRCYWPDKAVLDGTWQPPKVELVK